MKIFNIWGKRASYVFDSLFIEVCLLFGKSKRNFLYMLFIILKTLHAGIYL